MGKLTLSPPTRIELDTTLNQRDPFQQWQVVDIQFPSTPDTDLVIRHDLAVDSPRDVHYRIIKQFNNGTVYETVVSGAKEWTNSYIVLRSDTPYWTGRLLLGTLKHVEDFNPNDFTDIPTEPFCCSSTGSTDGEECRIFGTSDPLWVAPPAADGVTVTPSGVSWSNTAYVEIEASTPEAWILASVHPFAGTREVLNFFEVDIAVGAPGSEFVVATVMGLSGNNDVGAADTGNQIVLPIAVDSIPAGSRVSCRLRQASTDTTAWKIAIEYYKKPLIGTVPTTTVGPDVWPIGAPIGFTPSGTNWANGIWHEVTNSTGSEWFLSSVMFLSNNGSDWELDIGTGTAGNEVVVTTLRGTDSWFFVANGAQGGYYTYLLRPLFASIPAGTRVAVRLRKSGTTTNTVYCKLGFYRNRVRSMVTGQPTIPVPAAADSISLTNGNYPTFGPWVEFIASTSSPIAIQSIVPGYGGSNGREYIQIGVGALGSESTIATSYNGTAFTTIGGQPYLLFNVTPIIPVGTRVSLRSSATTTPSHVPVALNIIENPDFTNQDDSTVPGVIDGSSLSVSSAGSWVNSSWEELVSSTADNFRIMGYAFNASNDGEGEIDLGVGTSGHEQVITTLRFSEGNPNNASVNTSVLPVPHQITSGSRLSFRARTKKGPTEVILNLLYAIDNGNDAECGPAGSGGTGSGSGTGGSLTTPASSTDNAIVRWDGISGTVLQDSGIRIADGESGVLAGSNTGDVTLVGSGDYLSLTGQVLTKTLIGQSDLNGAWVPLAVNFPGDMPDPELLFASGAVVLVWSDFE